MRPGRRRVRFRGHIAGIGSCSSVRVVVGLWHDGPLGTFADAMVADATGHRVFLAPDADVARLVAATYHFDEIRIERFAADLTPHRLVVDADSLQLEAAVGRGTALGALLATVPRPLAEAPWFSAATDPVARLVLDGVRTRGGTGEGSDSRREWYGATGQRRLTSLRGRYDGVELGELRPVSPPPGFGFSSTPERPSVTRVTTTIELDADVPLRGR